jgi:hypothetical protein
VELYVQEFPTLPMKTLEEIKSRFSNQRQWRDFVAAVSAVQSSVNYSTVRHLQFATMFFNSAWARASEHLRQALNAPGAYTRYSGFGVRNLRA